MNKRSNKKIRVRCPYCNNIFILKLLLHKENNSFSGLRKTHCPYCDQVLLLPGDSNPPARRIDLNMPAGLSNFGNSSLHLHGRPRFAPLGHFQT